MAWMPSHFAAALAGLFGVVLTMRLPLAAVAGGPPVTPRPSSGCRAAAVATGRPLARTIDVGGVKRSYLLDVPDSVRPRAPTPVLFDFHGFGHSAAGVWRVSGFKDLAAREGFITVYPDGLPVELLGRSGAGWQIFSLGDNRDVAFTRAVLDDLERTYCVDRARVYATGFSNGAFFSTLLACAMADRFAAVAPVSGGRLTVPCDPRRAVPIIIFHGRQDDVVPVQQARQARDAWVEKDGCREHASDGCEWHRECRDGAEVRYCEADFGHHWPPEATAQIWDFFTQHPLQ
jgi:polyhydroxybutyrate depolymerase